MVLENDYLTLRDGFKTFLSQMEREIEVLKYLEEGRTNKGCAQALDISLGTVRFSESHSFSLLEAVNKKYR